MRRLGARLPRRREPAGTAPLRIRSRAERRSGSSRGGGSSASPTAIWMLISTPLAGDHDTAMRTFSNGGLIAGRDAVVAVEGFASEAGSRWLSDEARRLTGTPAHPRGPHPLPRRSRRGPRRISRRRRLGPNPGHRDDARPAPPQTAGGRPPRDDRSGRPRHRARPRRAHAPSHAARGPHRERSHDRDGRPAGRLVWRPGLDRPVSELRGRDAQPADGARAQAGRRAGDAVGARPRLRRARGRAPRVPRAAGERGGRRPRGGAARQARGGGGAREWKPPAALGDWVRFSDDYYEVAFRAWERELRS